MVLALSMGVPPVAADQPTYAELVDGGRAGWLFAPGDPVSLRETLEVALADPEGRRARAAAGLARAETLSWPRVGEQTAQLILGSDGHVDGSAT